MKLSVFDTKMMEEMGNILINDTMLSDDALKSYTIVNKIKKIKTPEFIGYEKFRRLLP